MLIENGISILELLFVIITISILVLIAYPRLSGITEKAYETNLTSNISSFKNLMTMYYQENNKYPNSTYDFNKLKNNVLNKYGELGDTSEVLKSHFYNADNNSDPKTYKLVLVSSKTNKTYIVTPAGVTTSP